MENLWSSYENARCKTCETIKKIISLSFPSPPIVQAAEKSEKVSKTKGKGMGLPQWEQQANLWRSELGISKTRAMWDALDQEPVGLTLTPRIQTLLNLVVAERTKSVKIKSRKNVMKALKNTVVDVSQNPVRKSFTKDNGNIGTLCTSTQLFHIGRGARILPPEMLWLQAHNPKRTVILKDISPHQLQHLAGEGMPHPCLGLCVWALCVTKGFPDPDTK